MTALVFLSGCAFFGGRPDTVRPAGALYEEGERLLLQSKYEAARDQFQRIVERHPDSDLVPVARFLVGETFYRDGDYEKAVPEFEAFVTLFPGHQIADLGQYRLARTYFDAMPSLERDQGIGAEGPGGVPEAHPAVPREPVRPRRPGQDRRLPPAAGPEGDVGGRLLRPAGQAGRRPSPATTWS